MKRQYFYDKQFRRYISQLIRLFSGFQVRYLTTRNGETVEMFRNIPCIWGDMSRMGATWLTENSENVHSAAPIMALNITSIVPSPDYRAAPLTQQDTHFSKKKKNPSGKGYLNEPETMYKVSQHMPVPYELGFNLDIITTSTEQKLEVLEQILCLYNPGFQMKANSSPFDIGKYFEITLDSIQWTSRSVPQGTSIENDIATLSFIVKPVFINTPSKIRRNTIIKRIVTNLQMNDSDLLSMTLDQAIDPNNMNPVESIVVTPTDYSFDIKKEDGEYVGYVLDSSNCIKEWNDVFDAYGTSDENDTWIRIRRTEDYDDENYDVYMMFEYTDDPTKIRLILDENSFKVPDVPPIDKIINPNKKSPAIFGNGYGTRYLLSRDIEPSNTEWGISAPAMSIIESTVDGWVVTFNPNEEGEHYVVNLNTNDQYFFDGIQWTHYVVGTYNPRYWMFDVQNVNQCA